jgi:transposase
VTLTAGQDHDSTQFEAAMAAAGVDKRRGPRRPKRIGGDKGYSYDRIRRWIRSRRMLAVIPYRENETARTLAPEGGFDRRTYRRRSAIECSIGWLKWARRIGTRFEKFATSFLGMLKLAILKRYLRIAFLNRA